MIKSNVFIISGPSGAGEDSIIEGLKKHFDLERVITTTTRSMRPGESQGNPYYFVSRKQFEADIQAGKLAEYAKEYNDNFYGVSKAELDRVNKSGKIGIWKIEYKGVATAKKNYPEIISIFITVSDLSILEKRIRRRDTVTEEYIQERMKYTKEWMKHADIYDYTVYNEEGKLKEAIAEIAKIIKENLK
jgi:guanylate kinase